MARIINKTNTKNSTRYSNIEKTILAYAKKDGFVTHTYSDNNIATYFSKLRENILSWYPFDKGCDVLEVGSDCGAITGMLCKKANKVTSFEFEENSAKINYKRHKDNENLEIVIGDFINTKINSKYDYVILNDILGYADYIINTKDTFGELVSKAKTYLKKNGVMLIIVNNALKIDSYLYANNENENSKPFINIHNKNNRIYKEFNKEEITEICERNGCRIKKWFYPYPNILNVSEIFTDSSINKMYPKSIARQYGCSKSSLLDNYKLIKDLICNKSMQLFANSFLLEINNSSCKNIDYVYIDSDKLDTCSTYSYINFKKQKAYVKSLSTNSKEDIIKIFNNTKCSLPKSVGFEIHDDTIVYDVTDGKTLEEIAYESAINDSNEIFDCLSSIKKTIYRNRLSTKECSKEFSKVFGMREFKTKLHWEYYINIDLLPNNILINKDNIYIIKPDIQFSFAIPAEYALWRTIYYLPQIGIMDRKDKKKICNFVKIDEEIFDQFVEAEKHFLYEYLKCEGRYLFNDSNLNNIKEQSNNYNKLENVKIQLELENNRLNNSCDNYIENLNRQNLYISGLKQQISEIENSRTWKMTYPVRNTMDNVKQSQFGCFVRYLNANGVESTFNRALYRLGYYKKIETYDKFCKYINAKSFTNYGLNLNKRAYKKRILFISHEMTLTGAPLALVKFATAMRDDNDVIFASCKGGELEKELKRNQIPYFIYGEEYKIIKDCAKIFDVIVVCSCAISTLKIINTLNGSSVPVMWWIHEAKESYYREVINEMPAILGSNISVYCVGDRALNTLRQVRPKYNASNLMYYIDKVDIQNANDNGIIPIDLKKHVFAMIGTIQERKAQDLLADAIIKMDKGFIEDCSFIFIGKKAEKKIARKVESVVKKYPDNVMWIESLAPSKMASIYKNVDHLVCVSRDDPMPIVVSEALSVGKNIIYSKNIGQYNLLRSLDEEMYVKDNSPSDLSNIINNIVKGKAGNNKKIKERIFLYEKYFSKKSFIINANKAINDTINFSQKGNDKVSIVIPTYNGEKTLKQLLNKINQQTNYNNIEIVAVDSGSKDGTIDLLKKYNAKIIEIPNEQFSHSYARNLGCENSSGNILLLMTQDALPSSNDWVKKMIEPIVNYEAAAVTCAEKYRDDSDLYYKWGSYYHSHFIGYDKVSNYNETYDSVQTRRNGNLNDVSTAISKDIFSIYKYRYNFAEDLDLGIRLIKDGYKIKYISTPVIHGHNRDVDYYLKRGLVEAITLKKILATNEQLDRDYVINDCTYSYIYLSGILDCIKKENIDTIDEFCDHFSKFEKTIKCNRNSKIRSKHFLISDFLLEMNEYKKQSVFSIDCFKEMKIYIFITLKDFLSMDENSDIKYTKEDLVECCYKHFCAIISNRFSMIKADQISNIINKYSRGV